MIAMQPAPQGKFGAGWTWIVIFLLSHTAHAQITAPYRVPAIPPVPSGNNTHTGELVRAGKLYLSLQDAIRLAIENNLNLESYRYGPILAEWALRRAEAGGPVRGVPSASAQVSSVNSGVGVNGTTASAGLGGGGGSNNGGGNGGAAIQQIGAITPNLDPILQNTSTFSHQSQPLANTVLSGTSALVQDSRTYSTVYQQGLLSGGVFQIKAYEQGLRENAASDALNPAYGPHADIVIRHSLLQGFGTRLNGRSIRIAALDIEGSKERFRSQTLDLVAQVVHLYWNLVAAVDTVQVRESAVSVARKFLEDTRARIQIGALARIELPRAEAELASREQDLVVARGAVQQGEIALKAAFASDIDAGIVVLDRMEVPEADDLPPLRELVASAMKQRPDVASDSLRDKEAQISAIGTENPLLPTLQVGAQTYNRGVAGTPQASGGAANPYFVGGLGTAAAQILRRNFPSESASVTFSVPLNNRQAQADYGVEQLQMRQSQIKGRRDANQILVDISNQVIALRQARARHATARRARELQEQLLEAEQQKFAFGKSAVTGLIVAQRALAGAQAAEIGAQSAYTHARVSLDQVLGETLEKNHVTVDEALSGARPR